MQKQRRMQFRRMQPQRHRTAAMIERRLQAADGDRAAHQRVGGRRWDLRFDNGVAVALPAEAWDAAWRRLAGIERAHRLLARELARIDLRFPDRMVIRLTEQGRAAIAEARERAKGEST